MATASTTSGSNAFNNNHAKISNIGKISTQSAFSQSPSASSLSSLSSSSSLSTSMSGSGSFVSTSSNDDRIPAHPQISHHKQQVEHVANCKQPKKQRQMVSKTNQFKCTLCKKLFKREENLKCHLKIHDQTAPKCPYCGRQFARKGNLRQHLLIHTNQRPFKCTFCDMAFRQQHVLSICIFVYFCFVVCDLFYVAYSTPCT